MILGGEEKAWWREDYWAYDEGEGDDFIEEGEGEDWMGEEDGKGDIVGQLLREGDNTVQFIDLPEQQGVGGGPIHQLEPVWLVSSVCFAGSGRTIPKEHFFGFESILGKAQLWPTRCSSQFCHSSLFIVGDRYVYQGVIWHPRARRPLRPICERCNTHLVPTWWCVHLRPARCLRYYAKDGSRLAHKEQPPARLKGTW